jgi:hypothetical protein
MMDIMQVAIILIGAHFFYKFVGMPYLNLSDVESYVLFVVLIIVYNKYGGDIGSKIKQTISSFGRRR